MRREIARTCARRRWSSAGADFSPAGLSPPLRPPMGTPAAPSAHRLPKDGSHLHRDAPHLPPLPPEPPRPHRARALRDPPGRRRGAGREPRLPGVALGLHPRRHRHVAGPAADPGGDLRVRDAAAPGVLVLAHDPPDAAAAPGGPPRGGADRDVRRGRGRAAPDGGRRPRHPQRRAAGGVGARRRRPRLGVGDVRPARRPLPEPPRAARAREGGEHQPRPAVRPRPSSW